MLRRRFLAAGATVAGGLLAGCTGNSGPEDGENEKTSATEGTERTGGTGTTNGRGEGTQSGTNGRAAFELASIDAPDETTMGQPFTVKVAVKNVGDVQANFSSPLHVSRGDTGFQQTETIRIPAVPPGKTASWSKKITPAYSSDLQYRIPGLGAAFAVTVHDLHLSLGGSYTSPTNVALTVRDIRPTSRYRYERSDGSMADAEAGDGRRWVFVPVTATNEGDSTRTTPSPASISLLVSGGSGGDGGTEDGEGGPTRKSPTSIAKSQGRYASEEVDAGGSVSGWVAYEVSADASASDMTVEWSARTSDGEWTVQWS